MKAPITPAPATANDFNPDILRFEVGSRTDVRYSLVYYVSSTVSKELYICGISDIFNIPLLRKIINSEIATANINRVKWNIMDVD